MSSLHLESLFLFSEKEIKFSWVKENVQNDSVKSTISLCIFARWPVSVITKGPRQNLIFVESEIFDQPVLNYRLIWVFAVLFVSLAMPLLSFVC